MEKVCIVNFVCSSALMSKYNDIHICVNAYINSLDTQMSTDLVKKQGKGGDKDGKYFNCLKSAVGQRLQSSRPLLDCLGLSSVIFFKTFPGFSYFLGSIF